MAQKYRVLEGRRFRGHEAGDVVEFDLSEDEERRAIERGSIEKTDDDTTTSDDKEES